MKKPKKLYLLPIRFTVFTLLDDFRLDGKLKIIATDEDEVIEIFNSNSEDPSFMVRSLVPDTSLFFDDSIKREVMEKLERGEIHLISPSFNTIKEKDWEGN